MTGIATDAIINPAPMYIAFRASSRLRIKAWLAANGRVLCKRYNAEPESA